MPVARSRGSSFGTFNGGSNYNSKRLNQRDDKLLHAAAAGAGRSASGHSKIVESAAARDGESTLEGLRRCMSLKTRCELLSKLLQETIMKHGSGIRMCQTIRDLMVDCPGVKQDA